MIIADPEDLMKTVVTVKILEERHHGIRRKVMFQVIIGNRLKNEEDHQMTGADHQMIEIGVDHQTTVTDVDLRMTVTDVDHQMIVTDADPQMIGTGEDLLVIGQDVLLQQRKKRG